VHRLRSRMERMEPQLKDLPCRACANTPRCFMIQDAADQAFLEKKMQERREACTCGRPFYVRRTILHLRCDELRAQE
jgi:hypothetical protein